jgi:hypothetical protein
MLSVDLKPKRSGRAWEDIVGMKAAGGGKEDQQAIRVACSWFRRSDICRCTLGLRCVQCGL